MNAELDPTERRVRAAMHELVAGVDVTPRPTLADARVETPPATRARWPRLAMAAALVALVASAGGLVWKWRGGDSVATVDSTTPPSTVSDRPLWADIPPDGSVILPPAPIAGRAHAATVWTGTEMIVWGGVGADGVALADGAAFDPSTGVWRTIAAPPIAGRWWSASAWTGSEMIVTGGFGGPDIPAPLSDGAAYDPASDTWRALPPNPVPASGAPAYTWTGSVLIVTGEGANGYAGVTSSAAYDPVSNSWTRLPDLAGEKAVQRSGATAVGPVALLVTRTADDSGGALYRLDTSAEGWSERGWEVATQLDPPRGIVATPGAVLGVHDPIDAIVAQDDGHVWYGVDASGVLLDIVEPPSSTFDDLVDSVWTGALLVRPGEGSEPEVGQAFDPATRSWLGVPTPAGFTGPREGPAAVWGDGVVLVWGGAAGTVEGGGYAYRPAGRTGAVASTTVPPGAGCPSVGERGDTSSDQGAVIDWVDVVQLGGTRYMRTYGDPLEQATDPASLLAGVAGTVCFTMEGNVSDPGYQMIDGDATFLPVGTELRAIIGDDPAVRLATIVDGDVRVYQTVGAPSAQRGGDVLDLSGTFVRIRLWEPIFGETLGQITGTDLVATLVQVLREAPVLPELDLSTSPTDGAFIELVRDDGSTVSFQVHTTSEGATVTDGNVLLGPRWQAAIDDAIASNGDEVSIVATHPDFPFYDPCGTSTIEVDGVTYYQMYREEVVGLDTSRYPVPTAAPTTAPIQGFARVVAPGPGDDVGTLVVYSDGVARFESRTGIVEWFTTAEHTYDWVC